MRCDHYPPTAPIQHIVWAENIAWKTPIPGLGWSSPAIQGDQIWLTTALDDGHSLRAICLNRGGQIVHDVEVFQKDDPGPIHTKNSHASPTPLIEGDRVYVHFGAHGTACLTTDGQIVWKTEELKHDHRHGPAGSPVVHGELLILNCDGTDVQFVVALDKRTGEVRWRSDREGAMAYSTPLLIDVGGRKQLISVGGEQVIAYDPASGSEIWRSRYPTGYSNVPRPVYGHGLVFVCSGYNTPQLYAIRPQGARGDVTQTHVAWKLERGAPHNPSPLLVGNELYIVSDRGIATCLDAKAGTVHWQERLGGNFSASPLFADGRIYLLNEEGLTTVVAPGTTFKQLAANQIDGRTLASLAVSQGAIYLRSADHLYRIEKRK
ncbi:MAG: PQQ-binding-like beta-propeller repeat protein [Planctomycetes bacterium]|nr:PQQ-binding-like beta-propeller repeat protein [Planctomycetota bacterium]